VGLPAIPDQTPLDLCTGDTLRKLFIPSIFVTYALTENILSRYAEPYVDRNLILPKCSLTEK
jgi:hypothetical protein